MSILNIIPAESIAAIKECCDSIEANLIADLDSGTILDYSCDLILKEIQDIRSQLEEIEEEDN